MESLVGNNKYIKFNPEPEKIRKNRFNMTELGRKSNNMHEQLRCAHVGAV